MASAGRLNPYDSLVFINCPFDEKYTKLFHAIVFAIHDLGFQARHALIDDGNAIRLTRITSELRNCKYSIHDLSRVETGGKLNLPRFNMPFEAGIAYGIHASATTARPHHLLLLDAKPYRYQASLSDAAGLDPKIHNGLPEAAIRAVRNFLVARSQSSHLAGAAYIAKRHALFFSKLPLLARSRNLKISEVRSWAYVNDLQAIMAQWIRDNPA